MKGLVKLVKGKVNPECLVDGKLKDGECSLVMKNLPRRRVAISLEHPSSPIAKDQPHCDFLFIAEEDEEKDKDSLPWVVLIEFKSGGFDTRRVATQLQGGATLLEQWVPNSNSIRFRAVVVSGQFPKGERQRFERQTLRFHGSCHSLDHLKCGSSLSSVIGA